MSKEVEGLHKFKYYVKWMDISSKTFQNIPNFYRQNRKKHHLVVNWQFRQPRLTEFLQKIFPEALRHERKESNDYQNNKNRRFDRRFLFGSNDKRDYFMPNIYG